MSITFLEPVLVDSSEGLDLRELSLIVHDLHEVPKNRLDSDPVSMR